MKKEVAGGAGRGGKLVGALVGAIAVAIWFVPSSGAEAPPRQVSTEADRAAPQARVEELDINLEDGGLPTIATGAVCGGPLLADSGLGSTYATLDAGALTASYCSGVR